MRVAAVQMTSGPNKGRNVEIASHWIRKAAEDGAQLIALPENFSWMGPDAERASAAEALNGPTLRHFQALARELSVSLLAGSIVEAGAPDGRFYNCSVLFDERGEMVAVYRKIHLFDVEVGDGAVYQESKSIAPGTEVVVGEVFKVRVGLSICYDLRFPELYRRHASDGARGIHPDDRKGSLGSVASRPRDREPELRPGTGPSWTPLGKARHLRAFDEIGRA